MDPKKQARNKTLLVVAVVLACTLGAYALWMHRPVTQVGQETPPGVQPQLTKEAALSLLSSRGVGECRPEGVEGSYRSCTMTITETSGAWSVIVTYEGLYDDSVAASRTEATVVRQDGAWLVN